MGLFSFFSAICVVLQMIGTILTGDIGGFLKSIVSCRSGISSNSCCCCDSLMSCQRGICPNQFDGIIDCDIIQGQLKELMYGLCVLNIFGCLICFIATVLGCTSVARHPSREEVLYHLLCYQWSATLLFLFLSQFGVQNICWLPVIVGNFRTLLAILFLQYQLRLGISKIVIFTWSIVLTKPTFSLMNSTYYSSWAR